MRHDQTPGQGVSLIRASAVMNCQSIAERVASRRSAQAETKSALAPALGRRWARTLAPDHGGFVCGPVEPLTGFRSAVDVARFGQMPGFRSRQGDDEPGRDMDIAGNSVDKPGELRV